MISLSIETISLFFHVFKNDLYYVARQKEKEMSFMLECYHWQHNKGFDKDFYFLEKTKQNHT